MFLRRSTLIRSLSATRDTHVRIPLNVSKRKRQGSRRRTNIRFSSWWDEIRCDCQSCCCCTRLPRTWIRVESFGWKGGAFSRGRTFIPATEGGLLRESSRRDAKKTDIISMKLTAVLVHGLCAIWAYCYELLLRAWSFRNFDTLLHFPYSRLHRHNNLHHTCNCTIFLDGLVVDIKINQNISWYVKYGHNNFFFPVTWGLINNNWNVQSVK